MRDCSGETFKRAFGQSGFGSYESGCSSGYSGSGADEGGRCSYLGRNRAGVSDEQRNGAGNHRN